MREPASPDFAIVSSPAPRALADLHAASFDPAWDADAFEALLSVPGTFALAALEGSGPVAMVLVRLIADEAEVLTVCSAPAFRGRGIAGALIREAAATLLAHGATALFLEVAADNAPAIALYEKLGFKRIGCRRGYYARPGGPVDAITMKLGFGKTRHSAPPTIGGTIGAPEIR